LSTDRKGRKRASARVAGLEQEIREEVALGERLRGVIMKIAGPEGARRVKGQQMVCCRGEGERSRACALALDDTTG
jgi:hypothetical protein